MSNVVPNLTDVVLTRVFVSILMRGTSVDHAEPGKSIILHLRCLSLESLLALRVMIVSGLLLNLLIDVIEQFLLSRPRVQLIVRAKDFNTYASCLNSAAGMLVFVKLEIMLL